MKISRKEILQNINNNRIVKMDICSPDISQKAKPGQFVMLMVNDRGERIPLSIVDTYNDNIILIFQEIGFTTNLLGKLNKDDSLYSLAGPLGRPSEIKKYGRVVLIAGGVGIAEIYSIAKAMLNAGNYVTIIIGARCKDLLFFEDELKKVSNDLFIATNDGSCGKKGFTTDVLEDLLKTEKYDLAYSVGPVPMMSKVSEITKKFCIKTFVSLNSIMLDGTGMCGSCRVTIGKETKFACVDGPEFDAHLVNWDELDKRNKVYEAKEKHICKLVASR